jgi:hypothetical protein
MYVLYNVHIQHFYKQSCIYRNLIHILYLRKYIIAFYIVRVVLFIKHWYDELLILTFSALRK